MIHQQITSRVKTSYFLDTSLPSLFKQLRQDLIIAFPGGLSIMSETTIENQMDLIVNGYKATEIIDKANAIISNKCNCFYDEETHSWMINTSKYDAALSKNNHISAERVNLPPLHLLPQ